MPRQARAVFPGIAHHVTQRGNHRHDVFYERGDSLAYLRLLRECASQHAIQVIAYCLMPNHVHLVVVPSTMDGLHRALKIVHGRYAQRVNRMRKLTGHFWQNRYFSAPLDATHLLNAVRYVELNPVRAGLAERAEDYEWSSAAAHCALHADPLVAPFPELRSFEGIGHWSRWLSDGLPGAAVDALRRHTARNLPCGSQEFIESLEAIAGRPLRFRPQGRPPRPQSGTAMEAAPEKVNVPFRKR